MDQSRPSACKHLLAPATVRSLESQLRPHRQIGLQDLVPSQFGCWCASSHATPGWHGLVEVPDHSLHHAKRRVRRQPGCPTAATRKTQCFTEPCELLSQLHSRLNLKGLSSVTREMGCLARSLLRENKPLQVPLFCKEPDPSNQFGDSFSRTDGAQQKKSSDEDSECQIT